MTHDNLDIAMTHCRFVERKGMAVLEECHIRSCKPRMDGYRFMIRFSQIKIGSTDASET